MLTLLHYYANHQSYFELVPAIISSLLATIPGRSRITLILCPDIQSRFASKYTSKFTSSSLLSTNTCLIIAMLRACVYRS